jgi:hypothetical protein
VVVGAEDVLNKHVALATVKRKPLLIGGVHLALGVGVQSSGGAATGAGGWWVAGEGAVLKGVGVEQQAQLYELGRQFGKGHFGEVWRAVSGGMLCRTKGLVKDRICMIDWRSGGISA